MNARDLKKLIQFEAIELYYQTLLHDPDLLSQSLDIEEEKVTGALLARWARVIMKMRKSAEQNYPYHAFPDLNS